MSRPPAPERRITAVLLDVGGTLWPEAFPPLDDRAAYLTARLCDAFPILAPPQALALLTEVDRHLPGLDVPELEHDTDAIVLECAERIGIFFSRAEAAKARRAFCVPVFGRIEPFPGAGQLLATIKGRRMRAIVVSNGVTRDREAYLEDFDNFGLARYLDAVISSVDVGFRKPHARMFEAALEAAGCDPRECVMVGNTEAKDIAPAAGLGMRTVLVCIERPAPPTSAADAVVTSLYELLPILERWGR